MSARHGGRLVCALDALERGLDQRIDDGRFERRHKSERRRKSRLLGLLLLRFKSFALGLARPFFLDQAHTLAQLFTPLRTLGDAGKL
jgi:hypothetical protein